jgi:hypothetical protein
MRRTLHVTLDIDCDEDETVFVEPSGEEQHVIAQRGRSRNLVARVVPVNPPIPLEPAGGKAVSRFVDRQRQLTHSLANAPPIKPRRRSTT